MKTAALALAALLALAASDVNGLQLTAPVFGTSSGSANSKNFRLAATALGQPIAGPRVAGGGVRLWSGIQLAGGVAIDSDADGLSDAAEALLATNIHLADSDADGLSDFVEVNVDGDASAYQAGTDTDPLDPDTDGDGLLDGVDPDPLSATATSAKVPLLPLPAQFALALVLLCAARRFHARQGDC